MKHLVKYYAMCRPIGWWGPVHREAVRLGLIEEHETATPESLRPLQLIFDYLLYRFRDARVRGRLILPVNLLNAKRRLPAAFFLT